MGNPIKWGGAEQGITQDALVPSVTLNLSIMSSRSFSEIQMLQRACISVCRARWDLESHGTRMDAANKIKIASGWMFETAFASVDRGEGLRA
jgi:hypothetical protein